MSNIVEEKSFNFAVRIVNLKDFLVTEKKEYDISRQLLRSGTSIGANIAEAQQAQSEADFVSKMNIALKEAAETKFWIKLLNATDKLTQKQTEYLLNECIEIEKLLYSIVKTTKNKN